MVAFLMGLDGPPTSPKGLIHRLEIAHFRDGRFILNTASNIRDVRFVRDRSWTLRSVLQSVAILTSSRVARACSKCALALVIAVFSTNVLASAAGATSSRQWSAPVVINAHGSHANQVTYSVSCPSAAFCAAADGNGNVTLRRNGRWLPGQPVKAGGSFDSVSCPTTTHCVAVAGGGNAVTFDGHKWSPALKMGPEAIYKISCPTMAFCAAVGASGMPGGSNTMALLRGHTWSSRQTPTTGALNDRVMDVSCATPKFCVAVNLDGQILTFNGVKWTSKQFAGSKGLISVSCATPAFCLAVADSGQSMFFDGRGWTPAHSIPRFGKSFAYSVSCASTTYCVVLGLNGYAASWSPGRWSIPVRVFPGGFGAGVEVSCSPLGTCLAVNDRGLSSVN